MHPPPAWVMDVGRHASGMDAMFSRGLLAWWQCEVYPLLFRMPHSADQSLAAGVSVRNKIFGL